jgi:hypothetical protein
VVERHLNHLHWTLFLRAAKGTRTPNGLMRVVF